MEWGSSGKALRLVTLTWTKYLKTTVSTIGFSKEQGAFYFTF
ncbi:hypothetical protein SUSAZ_09310 [Sulfolobus acidocaldarius SUSAZ]|nr:hypothetical protein SUSAZ_09310 [Sulfolobus acidocaldarius SUSAZ]